MKIGNFIKQPQGYKAFIPLPFPPEQGFTFSKALIQKASQATLALGKLDGITQLLPDLDFFLSMYISKDAASSSQIEGTQATMIDAVEALSKTSEHLPTDVDDVLHYIDALNYGLNRLKDFPFSLRFIKEIHAKLMDSARASHFANPGNFRTSQNWIGGRSPADASFIPPPAHDMERAMGELESFFHQRDETLPILKAGIIHAQFETIHPFLDGNGRTGRILITLFLWMENLLDRPLLFLSSYFKRYQQLYYERLNDYHHDGVEKWLNFFLDGVIEIANEAIETVRQINSLREEDMRKIHSLGKTAAESTIKLLSQLYKFPITNVHNVQKVTGFTRQGAQKAIDRLTQLGILELKDESKTYGRSFIYRKYIKIFSS
jgi:Fic family protein